MFKAGANPVEIKKIKAMAEAGVSEKDISKSLKIELKAIQGFVKVFAKKPKTKGK